MKNGGMNKVKTLINRSKKLFYLIGDYKTNQKIKMIVPYKIGDKYSGIYFYHIEKAAGTSITRMFLNYAYNTYKI